MTNLVGIINITPDSFSDGGQFVNSEAIIKRTEQLFCDGASFVDIGAESTRPGATPLTYQQEWLRLEPILPELIKRYPGKLSIDSYHPETIERVLKLGPVIVNDVTGLIDPTMLQLILDKKPMVIISHLAATNIQTAHSGPPIDDIVNVKNTLFGKASILLKHGYEKDNIILDPGIGFGKTERLNRELLTFAKQLPEFAVMIGYSRKRFLGEHRMEIEPNITAGAIAIASGATYLRVHDVKAHARLL